MGCASSKRIEAAVDVYRPAPSSFAVFDINAIEEPWQKEAAAAAAEDSVDEKPSHVVPAPFLDKLNAIEDASRSWDEVSKALEDLKPKLHAPPPPPESNSKQASPKPPVKNFSFHTLEELEAKVSKPVLKKHELTIKQYSTELKTETAGGVTPKSLKENIFILRDKLEREKEGKAAASFVLRRNPLEEFEEICPPGGGDSVVVYTTSLGGVRRTYEECSRVRQLLELHQVVFDERNVALDGGFLKEMRELVGEGSRVPRVFVKGRYIGGVEEVVALNETGRLSRILNWARIERGVGRLGCVGCGGARFVPCFDCGGSCKIIVGDNKQRCGDCNENGLVHCPACI